MMHHTQTPPVPPAERGEVDVPKAINDLVMKCLEKAPSSRPQSADELATLLAACQTDAGWTQDKARNWWISHPPEPHVDSTKDAIVDTAL